MAVCDVKKSGPRGRQGPRQQAIQQHRLQGLQRFPRAAGPQGHRRRARGHARPLARDHRHRGLPQRQGRVLPEARDADHPRRAADGRGGPPLRPRGFRRQPAGAGRLRQTGRRSAGAASWARSRRSTSTSAARRSPATCRASRCPPDIDWDMWLGPAPWAPYHPYRIERQLRHQRHQLAVLAATIPAAA